MKLFILILITGIFFDKKVEIIEKDVEVERNYTSINYFPEWQPIYMDSSKNQYTFLTQIQDPVFKMGDTIVFVFRHKDPESSWWISAAMSTDNGNTWTICRRINEPCFDQGGRTPSAHSARGYPTAHYSQIVPGPAGGYPVSLTGTWDTSCVWFGDCDGPEIQAFKVIPARLPDGTILVAISSSATGQSFQYAIYAPDLGTYLQTPTLVNSDFDLYGVDWFGGNVYAFGWDPVNQRMACFVYDYNSSTWTEAVIFPDIPVITLPNGEVLNTIMWMDGIVLNDGTPAMICDVADGSGIDTLAPWCSRAIFFLTPTSVETLVVPDTSYENHYYYPQLSIDRNSGTVYALWEKIDSVTNDTITGWGTWDIWASYSIDNGNTWSNPIDITDTRGENECMFQVAKRAFNGEILIAFAKGAPTVYHPDIDLYWVLATDFSGGVWSPVYLYLIQPRVSIFEDISFPKPAIFYSLRGDKIEFISQVSSSVIFSMYDLTGRSIFKKELYLKKGKSVYEVPDVKRGIYIIHIKTPFGKNRAKIMKF